MSIDSQTKRRSIAGVGGPALLVPPLADGTIGVADQAHLAGVYYIPPPPNSPTLLARYAPLFTTTPPPVEVYLCDPYGHLLTVISRFESLSFSNRLNSVGEFEMILPADFDLNLIQNGNIVDVWIAPEAGMTVRREFTGFIQGDEQTFIADGVKLVKVTGRDMNDILETRVNIEDASRTDFPDNIIRFIVGRNAGQAGGLSRSFYNQLHFDAEPRQSWGRAITLDASLGQSLGSVVNSVAKRVAEDAVYPLRLYYGVVVDGFNPLKAQFRVRQKQWGVDRSYATGARPCVLRPGQGLEDIDIVTEASEEANVILYKSASSGAVISEVEAVSSTRATQGIGIRREKFFNGGNLSNANAAIAARTTLRVNRRTERINAKIVQQPGAIYGKDYKLGDRVTFMTDGIMTDVIIDGISRTFAGGEARLDVKYEIV